MADRNVVQQIVDSLAETYNAEGIVVWLQAHQQWEGDQRFFASVSPLEMIRRGHADMVLARAQSFTGMVAT